MSKTARNITVLLKDYSDGERGAMDKLWPLVYDQLHRLARNYMLRERNALTLQPTALVNEAFMKLAEGKQIDWSDRQHFFAVAARVMRNVLVDRAKARKAGKRGGGDIPIEFDEKLHTATDDNTDVRALDEALTRLEKLDPRLAQVVELRYFAGLGLEEVASSMKLSLSTVKRDWTTAKLWLYREIIPKKNARSK